MVTINIHDFDACENCVIIKYAARILMTCMILLKISHLFLEIVRDMIK